MTIMDTGGGVFGGIGGGMFGNPTFLPALSLAFSSGLKAMGQIGQGNAMVEAAKRRQQAAGFEAEQLRVNAGQANAAAQRDAYFEGRKADMMASAIRARLGAGAGDASGLSLLSDVLARKAYNVQTALYGGQDKARLMEMQARAKQYDAAQGVEDAKAGRNAQRFAAFGTVASGAASLYEKYWPKNSDVSMVQSDELSYEDGASPIYMAQADTRKGRPTSTTGVRA